MREPKNQMLGTMEPPLMQLSVNFDFEMEKWLEINQELQLFERLGSWIENCEVWK